jgi:Pvc16 N-terminal domain
VSNFLAIATVTATLRRILEQRIGMEVPGTIVTAQPPDTIATPAPDSLNIFLYQITWNNGYNNFDLPSRNSKGELVGQPLVGLNLYYLLTPYNAANDDLQSHRILASAIRMLHETPVLSRDAITATVNAMQAALAGSDLAAQTELVKVTPQPISLEELTKIWSSIFQSRYRTSVAFLATVVLLHSERLQPKPAMPVRERAVYVLPFKRPIIERVEPQVVERTANAEIAIIGHNLRSDSITIQFGEILSTPEPEDVTDDRISILVPANLTSGIKPIQVIHNQRLGFRPDPYQVFRSNVAAFILAPRITNIVTPSVAEGSALTIDVEPAVAPRQKIEILLGDYTLSLPAITGTQPVHRLSAQVPTGILEEGQAQAEFLLRVRVDGAESFLRVDNQNRFTGPSIEVTAT